MLVKALFEYPVKGLRGSEVCCASVNSRGLKMDRRWMIVDSDNSFLSQRQVPFMANLLAKVTDELELTDTLDDSVIIAKKNDFKQLEEVEVWGQVVEAKKGPVMVNNWLTAKLKRPVKLVYMDEDNIRPVRNGNPGEIVSFADGYPLLLTASASLTDLNKRMPSEIGIDRFRTNIHVTTNEPFEEEDWHRIKIGDVVFRVIKKCARCTVINVDQQSGKVFQEPLKTLSTYRKEGNKVNFGMNLIPETFGLIHEGDKVDILN